MPRAWLERNPRPACSTRRWRGFRPRQRGTVFPITQRPTLRAADRSRRVHVRVRHHALHRRRLPGRGRALVRRRAGAQPRAPRRADAAGADLRRAARRAETRVPRVDGRLVPPGEPLRRPRRRALRRRLLPAVHRASGVDVERPAEGPVADDEGRERDVSTRWSAPMRRRRVRPRRAWGRPAMRDLVRALGARTCGGGGRRSACSSTGSRVRRSRRCGRWRPRRRRRWHGSTRSGRSTASACSTTPRSRRRWVTRRRASARTPPAWRSRASARRRRSPAA